MWRICIRQLCVDITDKQMMMMMMEERQVWKRWERQSQRTSERDRWERAIERNKGWKVETISMLIYVCSAISLSTPCCGAIGSRQGATFFLRFTVMDFFLRGTHHRGRILFRRREMKESLKELVKDSRLRATEREIDWPLSPCFYDCYFLSCQTPRVPPFLPA